MVWLQFLSLSVTVLSLMQKLPQILRIYRTKNADGISVSSVLLEETAYTLVLTYHLWRKYPLSTFSEFVLVYIQDLFLLWAIAKYSTNDKDKRINRSKPLYGIVIFCLYLLASLLGLVPEAWLNVCTLFVIPISASSKIIQLRTILTNKSVGQVSRTSWIIASYGSFARVLTNIYQTKDMKMVVSLLISFVLNLSIVIACTVYDNAHPVPASLTDHRKQKTT